MRTRVRAVACVLALALCALPSVAWAWANGPDAGDGYGTHDWILDHAIAVAGADWVQRDLALAATDDPDTLQIDVRLHLFRDKGINRGAPQTVADLYAEIVASYRAGDRATASYKLGLLAHYYGDIAQPFHTAYDARYYTTGRLEGNLHADYESTVDTETQRFEDHPEWAVPRTPVALADVRARTIATAKYSRKYWVPLRDALLLENRTNMQDSVVTSVTTLVLNRVCSDLADVVRAVPAGDGLSQPPARISVRFSTSSPSPTGTICAYATCKDAAGRPMEGVGVVFWWPTSSGPTSETAYTNVDGLAYDWQSLDGLPPMQAAAVVAAAATGGASRETTAHFTPTPVLASGAAGFKNAVSPTSPRQGTVVTARTTVRDALGQPVAGLKVTFTWKYKYVTRTSTAVTDATGTATVRRNIGRATHHYRVAVRAQAVSGGVTRTSTAYFTTR